MGRVEAAAALGDLGRDARTPSGVSANCRMMRPAADAGPHQSTLRIDVLGPRGRERSLELDSSFVCQHFGAACLQHVIALARDIARTCLTYDANGAAACRSEDGYGDCANSSRNEEGRDHVSAREWSRGFLPGDDSRVIAHFRLLL